MTVKIITGKALETRVASFGKVAKTFSESAHVVAASLIHAVNTDGEGRMKLLVSFYQSSPINLQRALRVYFGKFAKVAFDKDNKSAPFVFAGKKKVSDLSYLEIGPMDYIKVPGEKGEAKSKTLKQFQARIKSILDDKDCPAEWKLALEGILRIGADKTSPVVAAASAETKPVLIKAETLKTGKRINTIKSFAGIAEKIAVNG